jgi:hypothetical protein
MVRYDLIVVQQQTKGFITMHVSKILHHLLKFVIIQSRLNVLEHVITAALKTKKLTLTGIGRALDLPIQERSGIRKMDRFLESKHLIKNKMRIYKAIVNRVLNNGQNDPKIIVDWLKLPNVNDYSLRASLAYRSRAITLYEEVHPKKKENNHTVHKQFLKQLKSLLPEGCKPIIITDAGFKNPWFKAVLSLNWNYIGRVRGLTHYDDGKGYKNVSSLHSQASIRPKKIGNVVLTKRNPLTTSLCLIRNKIKGRKKYNKNAKVSRHKDSLAYSKSQREPWVLAFSVKDCSMNYIVNCYKFRMTIEESIRDLKSTQYGLSMEQNRTIKKERLDIWLLIATLANLVAWIIGRIAEEHKLHYQFQSNSIRHRRVLSFTYLGCQLIRKNFKIPITSEGLKRIAFVELELCVM